MSKLSEVLMAAAIALLVVYGLEAVPFITGFSLGYFAETVYDYCKERWDKWKQEAEVIEE